MIPIIEPFINSASKKVIQRSVTQLRIGKTAILQHRQCSTRGIKTLTTQLSSNEIGFPIARRRITRESVDDLQIPFRFLRHRKFVNCATATDR